MAIYLLKYIQDSILQVYANGEMNYTIKGVHARVSVKWNFQAPEGAGDTHYSIMRGTVSNLIIRQGKEQNYCPELYVELVNMQQWKGFEKILATKIIGLQTQYPCLRIQKENASWRIVIPDALRTSHEAHFAQVTKKYLNFLKNGNMPGWEVPNMIAKYYTTTQALLKAENSN